MTLLKCGGKVNCPQSVPVKELFKSSNIWQRYRHKFGGTFFMDHVVAQNSDK